MKTKILLLLAIPLMAFNCSPDELPQDEQCMCRLETFEYRTQMINGMPRLVRVMVNTPEFTPNDCSLNGVSVETYSNLTEKKWNCVPMD
jgi:hypothetical protein